MNGDVLHIPKQKSIDRHNIHNKYINSARAIPLTIKRMHIFAAAVLMFFFHITLPHPIRHKYTGVYEYYMNLNGFFYVSCSLEIYLYHIDSQSRLI